MALHPASVPRFAGRKPSTLAAARKLGIIGLGLVSHEKRAAMIPFARMHGSGNDFVVVDDRAGHTTQTMGLITRLNASHAIKRIRYNAFAALPNLFNVSGLAHLSADSRFDLKPPYPKMVIACGRRMAPILRAIKRASPETVTIYMMWPDSLSGIDLAVVPAHDNPPADARVLVTRAPLTAIGEWYLPNNMRLTPKDEVYVVELRDGTYIALEIAAYYASGSDTSGVYTIRWAAR